MLLISKLKLITSPEEKLSLLNTIKTVNLACNSISDTVWEQKTFNQFKLHALVYYSIREQYPISSQMVVRAISKVVDSYKLDKKVKRIFKPTGSIAYDIRVLRFKLEDSTLSIWTVDGRLKLTFQCSKSALNRLQAQKGESRLVLRAGEFYIYTPCEITELEAFTPIRSLGVDLGIKNIAVDSDGEFHTGNHLLNVRCRNQRLRAKLQSKGTKSSKRKLKKRSRIESNFSNDVNHCISKHLVAKAKRTQAVLVLEDLEGIRARVRASRNQRRLLNNWSFFDLQQKILYKAKLLGVEVQFCNPKNTSRTCPACNHAVKENRLTQSEFQCVLCGYAGHADHIAAVNISRRAVINQPIVAAA